MVSADAEAKLVCTPAGGGLQWLGCQCPEAFGTLSYTFRAQSLSEVNVSFLPPSCVFGTAGRSCLKEGGRWEDKPGEEREGGE